MLRLTSTTDNAITNNLNRWFSAADERDIETGKKWYAKAQRFCRKIAKRYDLDSYIVASVVSALSPKNKWERNKIDAVNVINCFLADGRENDVRVCTYNANKRRAFAILRGGIEISASSPKTHSFAMNVGLRSPEHVTIDVWHIRACLVNPFDGITKTQESVTPNQYRRLEALTSTLAANHGLKGYEFQAIVWVTIKKHWNR